MTTVGRWSPSKIRDRIIDGTWVSETRYAMELITPTSITVVGSGSSASVVGLGSVDFSAVTSLSLNGVFSAEYDNYMISMRGVVSSGDLGIQMRMRLSGTDATGTNYTHQRLLAQSTTVSGVRSTSQTAAIVGLWSATLRNGDTAFVYGPNLAQPTAFRGVNAGTASSASIFDYASTHSLSTAYDGCTLFVGANNMTGNVAVYGLRG